MQQNNHNKKTTKMKKLITYSIYIILAMSFKNSYSQIEIIDWQTGKKLYVIKDNTVRNWATNEAIFEYRDNAFVNSKTGERLYSLDKKILQDAKTGKKMFEYKNGKVTDSNNGNLAYELDHGTKIISDSKKGTKLFKLSQSYLLPEYFFLILISADLIK